MVLGPPSCFIRNWGLWRRKRLAAKKKSKKMSEREKEIALAKRKTPRRRRTPAEKLQEARHRRKTLNKMSNQTLMRERLATQGHELGVLDCIVKLTTMETTVTKKAKAGLTREEQSYYIVRTGILKTKLDAHFKMISKFLPDLRSLEFKEGEGQNPLAQAAKAWAEALNKKPD